MARKGMTLCAACCELTPSGGGYCRLCKTPLIQAAPGDDEGHCSACGALCHINDDVCYGCGWQMRLPKTTVFTISLSILTLSILFFIGLVGVYTRVRWGIL